jgi:DNA-binding winged helix-turn-helix (wHTH) protein/tetratricopeptide (TPR) repeat protein/TolB-like protein
MARRKKSLESDFRIGDWLVQPQLNRLFGGGKEIRVEPKAMEVLAYLVEHAGQVVPKEAIIREVWSGAFVTDEVLTNAIWELRKALGDDARHPTFIQTVPRRGYRLIASVSSQLEPRVDGDHGPFRRTRPTDRLSHPPTRASDVWNTENFWLAGHTVAAEQGRWSRRRVAGIAAATALILAGAAVATYLFTNRSTASDPMEADGRPSLAIMSFEDHTGAQELGWLSRGVSSMLQVGLAGTSGLRVVSGHKVQEIVRQICREENIESIDESLLPEVARRAGASAILIGNIFQSGSEIRIDAQVEDVVEGKILSAHKVRGNEVFRLVDELSREIGASFDLDETAQTTSVTEVTTDSLEALRLYSEGLEAMTHLRLGDAERLLLEAVSVDPSFGMAYWLLHKNAMVRNDAVAGEKYLQRMLSSRDRLPDRQKLLARASQTFYDGALEQAAGLLDELVARYPDEEIAYVFLAKIHLEWGDPGRGLAVLENGMKAVPGSGLLLLYYGYGMLRTARYPEAIRHFESYARMYPDEANPYDSLGEAYLIAGMPDRAMEEYSRALGVNDSFSSSRLGRAWAGAMMGRYQRALGELERVRELPAGYTALDLDFVRAVLVSRVGRYQEAEALIREAIRSARETGDPLFRARGQIFSAILAVESGAHADAVRRANRAMMMVPDLRETDRREILLLSSLLAGIGKARDGRPDEAQEDLQSVRELHDGRNPEEKWWFHLLEGEIALAKGDYPAADAAFSDGEPQLKMWFSNSHPFDSVMANLSFRDGLARAKAARGDLPAAIRIYRKLLSPDISQRWTGVLEPLHVLELASLLQEQGNQVAAEQQRERFMSLWTDADQDLPGLKEAGLLLVE